LGDRAGGLANIETDAGATYFKDLSNIRFVLAAGNLRSSSFLSESASLLALE
jgi:hypothetical protein